MPIGNCFIGLLIIMIKYRFRGKIIKHYRDKKQIIPHLLYKLPDGSKHHYKLVKDIFRGRLAYLSWVLFWGKFEIVLKDKKRIDGI